MRRQGSFRDVRPQEKTAYHAFLVSCLYLNPDKHVALIFPLLFLLRRVCFAMAVVFLSNQYLIQCFVWVGFSLAMMVALRRYSPFNYHYLNQVAFVNELFVFIAGCCMMPLSNVLTNLAWRDNFGRFLIFWLCLCIIVNIIIIIFRCIHMWKKYVKKQRQSKFILENPDYKPHGVTEADFAFNRKKIPR